MFEQDYLMRMLMDFIAAVRRSMDRAASQNDPRGAAEALEAAVGSATEMDGQTLLSLAPDSLASILQVSGTDPKLAGYISRSLLLAGRYYHEAGDEGAGELRRSQALAIASAYGENLDDEAIEPEELEAFFQETAGLSPGSAEPSNV